MSAKEDLVLQASARHQCLPFQAVARGRCQQILRSSLISDRSHNPWQSQHTSTLRQRKRVIPTSCRGSHVCRRSLLRVPEPFMSLVASCYLGFWSTFLVFAPCSAGQVAVETCWEKNGSHYYGGDRKRWTGSRSRTLAPPRGAAWIVDRDP
jgi:hypothetical protein